LECALLFSLSTGSHGAGERLLKSKYPTYFNALRDVRAIVADDARTNDATRELADEDLARHDIRSMLDAPIIRDGAVVGVVCHEHVGSPRRWTQKEIDFASSVADIIALIFEQADRLDAEARFGDQKERELEDRKMDALERFARAIAHDFNNVLSTVTALGQTVARSSDADAAAHGRELLETVTLGTHLTQQLLELSRSETAPRVALDFSEVLQRLEPMLHTLIDEAGGTLEVVMVPTRVLANETALERILLNLCSNARDALSAGGHVRIALRAPRPDEELPAGSVVLEVTDDGHGMDEEILARVFEPYFSTKPEGTGLGLASVYAIVRQLGGEVHVSSEPAGGSTFVVALPQAE
jgi:signal transduction histidine kinase